MKPAPFDYQAPATLREAISLLGSHPEAAVIAGGQSLMPVLAFRLATPSLLVDLRRIQELDYIGVGEDGVRLGALVRWRAVEDDQRLVAAHPLLREAVAHVAHYQIRNRGTVGGSLAHADPAAELPGVAVTCEGKIAVVGSDGSRMVAADEFFTGPLSTLRRPDEIIAELRLPYWPIIGAGPSGNSRGGRAILRWPALLVFYDKDDSGQAGNAHAGAIGVPIGRIGCGGRGADERSRAEDVIRERRLRRPRKSIRRTIYTRAAYRRASRGHSRERALAGDARERERMMRVEFRLNGKAVGSRSSRACTLADCLRDDLKLTGTHVGCEHGVCGACTVIVDGEAVRSCLMFAVQADGATSSPSRACRPATAEPVAGGVPQASRAAVRVLHARHV